MSDDLVIDGGEAGGIDDKPAPKILLKRSELAVLRRMADRYPIVEGERRETVDCVMDIVRNAKSKRLRLAAVGALMGLEKVNLDELKTYVAVKRMAADDLKPGAGSTITIDKPTINIIEQLVVSHGHAEQNGNGSILQGPAIISPQPGDDEEFHGRDR